MSPRVPPARSLLLIGLLHGLAACGGSSLSSLNYGDNARQAYSDALEDFYDDDCIEAEPEMRNVRRQFPYTRFAALAELRIADCLYKSGKYAEAIQAYDTFVRYRPSHVEVSYARFMSAQSQYDQIPSEWLLSPPTYEREQRFTQESLRLLRRFILDYPDDPLVARAKRMADHAVKLLAQHELYVATFYLDRDHPQAAVGRLRTLITTYPGSGYEPKALLMLGETYLELHDAREARKSFEQLTKEFPKSEQASAARDHLRELGT
ncbi:MAG TPA: outer membrane protein assembly factor BamD [Polyangiales bacterium]|jgi:outer membrane protein assembly factor BamD|nr:outer membrane protein assembly factor BamD [Polyangiales bacterium]